MIKESCIPKWVLSLLDLYLVIEYRSPSSKSWRLLRQVFMLLQVCSFVYNLFALYWLIVTEKQGTLLFILCCRDLHRVPETKKT